jgi:hypothetical protein
LEVKDIISTSDPSDIKRILRIGIIAKKVVFHAPT